MSHNKEQRLNNERESTSPIERRAFEFQARASNDGAMTIGGSAALYDRYTSLGWFAEVIERGFFDDIDMEPCVCLYNHDVNYVLGRKKAGTLELKVTENGLEYESKLPESRRDVFEAIERGDVYQSSFGFTVREAEWVEMSREELQGKLPDEEIDRLMYGGTVSVRRLKKGLTLYDVSPVTFPAYADTTVAKRSFDAVRRNKQQQSKPHHRSAARARIALALHS